VGPELEVWKRRQLWSEKDTAALLENEAMTPEQKIKHEILIDAIENNDDLNWEGEITAENVAQAWEEVLVNNNSHWDFVSEFRASGEDTGLPSQYSRHYEAKEVARKLTDGTWVGWTYWYGGGKHGEPGAIEWMEDAYFLDVKEEEKVVMVREFTKIE
jgi:hypothetical protein